MPHLQGNTVWSVNLKLIGLLCALYVLYAVKYIDLVSLDCVWSVNLKLTDLLRVPYVCMALNI